MANDYTQYSADYFDTLFVDFFYTLLETYLRGEDENHVSVREKANEFLKFCYSKLSLVSIPETNDLIYVGSKVVETYATERVKV